MSYLLIDEKPTTIQPPSEHIQMYSRFAVDVKQLLPNCSQNEWQKFYMLWYEMVNCFHGSSMRSLFEHKTGVESLIDVLKRLDDLSCIVRSQLCCRCTCEDSKLVEVEVPFRLEYLADYYAQRAKNSLGRDRAIPVFQVPIEDFICSDLINKNQFCPQTVILSYEDMKGNRYNLENCPDDITSSSELKKFYCHYDGFEAERYMRLLSTSLCVFDTGRGKYYYGMVMSALVSKLCEHARSLLNWLTYVNATAAFITKQDKDSADNQSYRVFRYNKNNATLLHMIIDEIGAIYLAYQAILRCSLRN